MAHVLEQNWAQYQVQEISKAMEVLTMLGNGRTIDEFQRVQLGWVKFQS